VALTLAELEEDPHATFARLRDSAPVAWVDGLEGWIVIRRDLALEVMRDARTFTVDDPRFTTSRVIGPSMLSRDGGEHARHRAPFARPFRLAAVRERFTAFVAEETDRLLDGSRPRGRPSCAARSPGRSPRRRRPTRSAWTARRPARCCAGTTRSSAR
jgi:cytochrome P450